MKPLEEIYGKRFFARRHKLHWRAPYVCGAINNALHPKSTVDVGCATGDLVLYWKEGFEIDSYGIEGSHEAKEFFVCEDILVWDLRESWKERLLKVPKQDLCTCFEVAEHIEPEYASMFAYNLTLLSDKVLISAAPPGQGGHHHVNCRIPLYWEMVFSSFQYKRKDTIAKIIKEGMEPWKKKDGIRAFYNNLLYFEKEKS